MNHDELIRALNALKVETGSLACLGCGHERSCSTHGCAVIRQAVAALQDPGAGSWIRCTDALPTDPCELVLVIVNGWANGYTPLVNSCQMAVYSPDEGWMLEEYPDAEEITVSCWTPVPQLPEWL